MGHHCNILQIRLGLHIFLQCLKMTFGDHITLQSASNLYNIAFQVLSSNGPGARFSKDPVT